MRASLALALILVASGVAFAAERKRLPDFFEQSFDAVAAKPLAPYVPEKADETGAIPPDGVPMPPQRPDVADDIVIKRKPLMKAAGASKAIAADDHSGTPATVRRPRNVSVQMVSSVPAAAIAPGTAAAQPVPAAPAPGPLRSSVTQASPRPAAAQQPPAATVVASAAPTAATSVSQSASKSGGAFTLKVPASVRISGATSFVVDSRHYQLASLEGLGVDTRCTPEANGRCIRHPMRALKQAIAGKTLQCRPMGGSSSSQQVACAR